MKTTIEPLFSNGTEFMRWQNENCCRCRKAVWYNEKTDTYPKHKCALQRDIEAQLVGFYEINMRTYNMIHGCRNCPMFIDKDAPVKHKTTADDNQPSLFTADDLARGESMVDKVEDVDKVDEVLPPPNDTLPISATKREESPITDTDIADFDPKKGGIATNGQVEGTVAAQSPVESTVKFHPYMANTFMHQMPFNGVMDMPGVTQEMKEAALRKAVHDDVTARLQKFTFQEHMRIVFAPLAISHMVWIYTMKVLKYAADNRIEIFKKLCRATRHVREEYIRELRKDLTASDIDRIESETANIVDECATKFFIMQMSCMGELRKLYGNDVEDLEMRANAYIGLVLLRVLDEHNHKMDDLIRQRMGYCTPTRMNPWMVKLRDCLDAFQGGKSVPFGTQVTLCKQIVHNSIGEIEWCTN